MSADGKRMGQGLRDLLRPRVKFATIFRQDCKYLLRSC